MKRTLTILALCFTAIGLASCGIMFKGDPQWDPPTLSKMGCPDIDGVYVDNNLLSRQFNPYRPAEGETIPMKTVSYDRLPSDAEAKQAHTQIRRQGNLLHIIRTSPAGERYIELQLDMNHPWVGCHNGQFIIREFSLSGGSEGSCGTAYARDAAFQKRADGILQLDYKRRQWNCSMSKEPKRTNGTLLFSPVAK